MRFGMWIVLAGGLVACIGDDTDKPDTDTDTETDTDTDTDADSDADADTDSDADTDVAFGEVLRKGAAVADVTDYAGTESLEMTSDKGYGDVVCVITLDVNDIAVRKDCPACDWAHDVELTGARIETNTADACDGLLTNLGIANVSELDGETRSFGMIQNKAGHIPFAVVTYNEDQKRWRTFADGLWDSKTGVLTYEKFFDVVEY